MTDTPMTLRFTLNGAPVTAEAAPNAMAIDLLRDRFGLTGVKLGCDQAVCGACTILVDGRVAASCATFAFQLDGAEVLTVEGLAASEGTLDAVQQAFVDNAAFQCGFCTPGMVLLAKALLDRDPNPDRETIRTWIGANICRCTGYEVIFEAVENAARSRAKSGAET